MTHDKPVQEIRWPHRAAVVQVIDVPRVLRAAERARAVIDFKVGSGEMIGEGAAVAVVSGQTQPELEREVLKAVTTGEGRTFEQDPAFALRLLADIGLRALSPAVNDPTTAVEALDAMDGLLRVLATRDLSVAQVAGSDGAVRVRLVLPTWEDYVAVALDAIIALAGLFAERRAPDPTTARRACRDRAVYQAIRTRNSPEPDPRPRSRQPSRRYSLSTAPAADPHATAPCTVKNPLAAITEKRGIKLILTATLDARGRGDP